MLKTIKNPDNELFKEVQAAVKANGGFCPCQIDHTPDTKCPCKEFREQRTIGECHCGLMCKVEA